MVLADLKSVVRA